MITKNIILGSNSYIGKHISDYLLSLGHQVEHYSFSNKRENQSVTNQFDITNIDSLEKIDWNVDFVYLFTGITGTLSGFNNPKQFVNVNEIGLINVLNTIKNSNTKPKIIFPSTRLVYKSKNSPLNENDEKETNTIYALNKLTCEKLLEIYKKVFNINYTIFRIGVPYGTNHNDYSFGTVNFMINQAKQEGKITLFGNGGGKRTFTHIQDLCQQIVLTSLNDKSNNEIYNIGGITYSLYDVAKHIANNTNSQIEFKDWPILDLKIESGDTFFCDDKIKQFTNIKYQKIEDWNFL